MILSYEDTPICLLCFYDLKNTKEYFITQIQGLVKKNFYLENFNWGKAMITLVEKYAELHDIETVKVLSADSLDYRTCFFSNHTKEIKKIEKNYGNNLLKEFYDENEDDIINVFMNYNIDYVGFPEKFGSLFRNIINEKLGDENPAFLFRYCKYRHEHSRYLNAKKLYNENSKELGYKKTKLKLSNKKCYYKSLKIN